MWNSTCSCFKTLNKILQLKCKYNCTVWDLFLIIVCNTLLFVYLYENFPRAWVKLMSLLMVGEHYLLLGTFSYDTIKFALIMFKTVCEVQFWKNFSLYDQIGALFYEVNGHFMSFYVLLWQECRNFGRMKKPFFTWELRFSQAYCW